jgi:sugar phosphate isomerase/epimerase
MFTRFLLGPCLAALVMGTALSAATSISNADKTGGFLLAVPARGLGATTLFEAIDKTKAAGGKVIDLEVGQKLSVDGPVFDEQMAEEQIKMLNDKLEGIKAVSATLVLGTDAKKNEKIFELAQKLGLTTLNAELAGDAASWVPKEEGKSTALDRIRNLADKFDINVALINIVKVEGSRLWEPNYLLSLVTNRTVRLGVCADTQRFAQSGLDPLNSLRTLNGRVFACRLSDLEKASGNPVAYGAGASDLKGMLVELKRQVFDGPLLIETATASSAGNVGKCRDFVKTEGDKAAAAGKRACRSRWICAFRPMAGCG